LNSGQTKQVKSKSFFTSDDSLFEIGV